MSADVAPIGMRNIHNSHPVKSFGNLLYNMLSNLLFKTVGFKIFEKSKTYHHGLYSS